MPRRHAHRLVAFAALTGLALGGLLVPAQAWAAPPSAPAAPTLTTDGQSLDVAWTAPAGGGAAVTGYLVEVLDPADVVVSGYQLPAGTTTHRFSGLDDGTYSARVRALSADGPSPASAESPTRAVSLGLLARWTFEGLTSTGPGAAVPDASGNNRPAVIRNAGATTTTSPYGGGLALNGGPNNSGAYVEMPTGLVDGQDTITVSAWLRNETGSGNYAALFLGDAANPPSRYVLVNPRNPAGRLKAVITDGAASTTAPWGTERGISPTTASRGITGPLTSDAWAQYTTVITPTSITAYLDGAKVGTVAHTTPLSSLGSNLLGYIGRSSYPDATYRGGVRDVRVYTSALSDATVAAQYADAQAVADAGLLSVPTRPIVDLDLPTTAGGSQVRWTSSAPAALSATGTLTRSATDVPVTLSAAVTRGGQQTVRTFAVTVPAVDDRADTALVAAGYDVAITAVTGDITLRTTVDGVAVSWASSQPAVLAPSGAVTRPAERTPVTLTGTFTKGTASTQRQFRLDVLPADAGRIGTSIKTGNENRTDAVHLAFADGEATSFTALNNDRPVLYGPNPQTRLGSPRIFRKPDGTFGLIATVDSNSTTAWLYDSTDLVTFTNPRQVTVAGSGQSTAAFRVAYDNAIAAYRVTYTSGGTTYQVRSADLARFSAPAVVAAPAPEPATTFPVGSIETATLGLTAAELARVKQKFTRMTNTGLRAPDPIEVAAGGPAPVLPTSVAATYSNGGADARMPVTWDPADVAAVDTATPGTYVVDGTVSRPTYPDTIGFQRADPDVTRGDDGLYYQTASFPQRGAADREGYDRVNLRRATTIAGLENAPETTIWHENTSATLNRYIWAPELTKIGDTWYVLFTAARGGGVFDIRPAMLRHTGGDLMNRANWVEVGQLLATPGDDAFTHFSLDMTHVESAGRHFMVWAEKIGAVSELRIAEIDPADPQRLTSRSRVIATPQSAWEVNLGANQFIDEGPAVIERDGRLLMTFSGSTVDDRYSVGLLSARVGSDPLDPASWTKTAYPLLVTADLPAGQSGPGHNSFTTDEWGNTVIVYHARDLASTTDGGLTDPSRWARARTVHFDADGDPVLNLTAAEELAPGNTRTQVVVTVRAPVTPPAAAPGVPATPAAPATTPASSGPTLSVRGPRRVGRSARLVIANPVGGRVVVRVDGVKRVLKTRAGTARVSVRFTRPGKHRVMVRTSAGRIVQTVTVRRR